MKHLYVCSQGELKIMPIYQANDYMQLQIKEKKFVDRFKPKLNKTWIIHIQMDTNTHIYIYIYIYTHKNH